MGDDAQYLMHARALAEGRDYTDIGYIYTLKNPVVGPVAYPPGGPFLMAPLFLALDDPIPAVRLLVLLMSVGFIALAGVWATREFGPVTAFAALLLLATNPGVVASSSRPLSDLSFGFVLWGVFVAAGGQHSWTPLRVTAITLLGSGAVLFRAAGISLVPALIAHIGLQRPERRRIGLIPLSVWSLTFAAVSLLLPTMSSYTDQIGWDLPSLLRNVARAVRRYMQAVADGFHYPFPGPVPNDLYHLAAAGVVLLGLWVWTRKNPRNLVLAWGAAYVALLLSYTTHTNRFVWPLLPLILSMAFVGVDAVAHRLAPASWRSTGVVTVLLAVAIALPSTSRLATAPPEPDMIERSDVRQLFAHMERRASEHEVRATFFNPRVLTWQTDIPAMGIFDAPPDEVLSELCSKGITHVILGDVRPVEGKDLAFRATVETFRDSFTLELSNGSFEVWRLDRTTSCRVRQ
jgi:hypothetical protein